MNTSARREPIAVIGTGYVGLVTAAGFAELGNDVWCVDIDTAKVEGLQQGKMPIFEQGLAESLAASGERVHYTTDLALALEHARIVFICVGTPTTYTGDADLSAVHAVVASLPVSDEHVLVMKSTVPVGTGASVRRLLDAGGKSSYAYVSCPEFLKEGAALADFRAPDRVVIGDDGGPGGDAVAALYAPLDAPLVRTDIASAEMIKLAANAFLATKISFINEIANVCEETGADVLEVSRGMGLDPRIGPHFLKPGLGFGGSCLPGHETLLVRYKGRTSLLSFEELWTALSPRDRDDIEVIEPNDLDVLSYEPGESRPVFLPVTAATRRWYTGPTVQVTTTMGRRVTTTADHPWITGDGERARPEVKQAVSLRTDDWVPLPLGSPRERAFALPGGRGPSVASDISRGGRGAAELSRVAVPDLPSDELGSDDLVEATQFAAEPLDTSSAADGSWVINDARVADTITRRLAADGVVASIDRVQRDDAAQQEYIVRTGAVDYRQFDGDDTAWVRVLETKTMDFSGEVYSLEVADAHTFITTGGVAIHNCFPKDVSALKRIAGNSGYHFQLLTSVIEVNELQKRRVIAKLQKHLGSLIGKRVALLGLAFKAQTDDMREASSLVLSARLQGDGATVTAYDPIAMDAARPLMPGVEFAESVEAAVKEADAVVLVTEWPEFGALDWNAVGELVAGKVLIDGRNFIDGDKARAAGFVYEGTGR
jgi:UDP-glucose 6-dehydrogenase